MPGGSSPAGNTTTTTVENNTPWGPEQGDLKQILAASSGLYTGNPLGPAYYPGQTYAPLNNTENIALGGLFNTGMNGTPALNSAQQGVSQVAGESMDPNSNPYLKQAESNTVAATLPGIQVQFNAGGRSDSGLAASAAASGVANALGTLNYGQYNTDAQQKVQAGLVAPGLNQATLGGQQAAFGAGQATQTDAQNQIQALMNAYNYDQARPYNGLSLYEQELGASGAGQYGQSSGSTTQPYFENEYANVGAGLAGLGGLASGLFGNNSGSGSNGGLLGWLFSDRRLKTDIHKIGEADNGLAIYVYRYRGSGTPHLGFMADEVKKLHPEAVVRHPSGFDMVNYERAPS